MSFIPFLVDGATQQVAGSAGFLGTILPFLLIIVIFYFFLIRPQNKKQKETEKMLNSLKKGDKVITIGGIHGVVSSVKEHTVIVKVDENTKIEFNRSAISSKELSDEEKAKIAEAEAAKKAAKAEKSEKRSKLFAKNTDEAPAAAETSEETK